MPVTPQRLYVGLGLTAVLLLITFLIAGLSVRRDMMSGATSHGVTSQAPGAAPTLPFSGRPLHKADLMEEASSPSVRAPEDGAASASDRLIIKTGSLSMVVKDVASAIAAIGDYAETHQGFVVSSEMSQDGIAPSGHITIRIPSDVFDAGVADLKELGEVKSESVNGQDVTEEYVDLEAQLKNLRATEEQFLAILKQAEKIEDILNVQRELANVRSQIERIEGRMKYLTESARLSTLTVYLSTDPAALPVVDDKDRWKPWAVAKDAMRDLVEVGKLLVNGLIRIIVFAPVLVVFGVIIWYIYRRFNRNA